MFNRLVYFYGWYLLESIFFVVGKYRKIKKNKNLGLTADVDSVKKLSTLMTFYEHYSLKILCFILQIWGR